MIYCKSDNSNSKSVKFSIKHTHKLEFSIDALFLEKKTQFCFNDFFFSFLFCSTRHLFIITIILSFCFVYLTIPTKCNKIGSSKAKLNNFFYLFFLLIVGYNLMTPNMVTEFPSEIKERGWSLDVKCLSVDR